MIPRVVPKEEGKQYIVNDAVMSPQEALLDRRILFLYGIICPYPHRYDNMSASYITDMLMYFDSQSHDPVYLVIDSPGGMVDTGLTLYDTIRLVESPVWTIGRSAASMATILLAAGDKGHRYVYPNSTTMLHLPSGQLAGDARDLETGAKQMDVIKNQLVDLLIECGVPHTRRKILKDIDRDYWMRPEDAIDYGLADLMADTNMMREIMKAPQ